jgi:G patch domain-containing protein 1
VWEQVVTDTEGRRRFHGAFTGGFSAGYFNTVGSKEGWTPSTFVSSRAQRVNVQQRAEDYMDDDDYSVCHPPSLLFTATFSRLARTYVHVHRVCCV